jgi:hypothetical protein
MILPSPDPSCRRLFHADRLTAEGHRAAFEIWLRATGREREGTRVVVYRCKRCAGFHVCRRRVVTAPVYIVPAEPLIDLEAVEPNLFLGL